MESFYCIPTGRTLFWKIFAFESSQVKSRALAGFSSLDSSL